MTLIKVIKKERSDSCLWSAGRKANFDDKAKAAALYDDVVCILLRLLVMCMDKPFGVIFKYNS